ncbi:MAG: type II 3-dehydroquinate dehydratase [Clostridia bacterium]|nr:type II 3-dehydroquinate dehydratase [Clostridia bacterium]
MALRCGLIGGRLIHSYSPQIHAKLGDYEYKLYELREDEVGPFLKSGCFDGLNVTIPYKKTVVPFLDELSEDAARLGSVNTVIRRSDGTLYGDNTDIFGALKLLELSGAGVAGKKVLVLGSGGTGVTFMDAVGKLGGIAVNISRKGEDNYENLDRHIDAEIVMNATPVGMYPDTGKSPVDLDLLPNVKCVLDAIYNPAATELLLQARKRGIKALNGLCMLVAQALRSSELFTGKKLPDNIIPEVTEKIAAEMYGYIPDTVGIGRAWAAPRPENKLNFLVINGPNLNMLGIREPEVYGKAGYKALLEFIRKSADEAGVNIRCFQSNHEGAIVDEIQGAYGNTDGIIINPAAYTHTSVAILDALKAVSIPAVEVHISDVSSREPFRQISYAGMACIKTFAGMGFEGYRQAIKHLKQYLTETTEKAYNS